MTSLQKEVSRRLPEVNCTSRYDEKSGRLNIDYEGAELLSLHKDNIVFFREENHQPEERLAQCYKVNDLIHKVAEYVRAYDAASKEEVTARLSQHQQWLKERESILKSAREMFGASEEKEREFAASIPDRRANLSGLEIRDMDLSAYDLSGVICKGSKIENCVLGSIAGMDLSGSQIFNSKLIGSNMSYARFNDAQMDQVTVQDYETMAHADFTG